MPARPRTRGQPVEGVAAVEGRVGTRGAAVDECARHIGFDAEHELPDLHVVADLARRADRHRRCGSWRSRASPRTASRGRTSRSRRARRHRCRSTRTAEAASSRRAAGSSFMPRRGAPPRSAANAPCETKRPATNARKAERFRVMTTSRCWTALGGQSVGIAKARATETRGVPVAPTGLRAFQRALPDSTNATSRPVCAELGNNTRFAGQRFGQAG